jgi:hypothetical protein
MQSETPTADAYIDELPEGRKAPMQRLREVILESLPDGFEETMSYGMIGYVVPHSVYPSGYHCDPKLPLPFLNIASQKNHIGFYHMGIYANKELMAWFKKAYADTVTTRLDMGKSCIRFRNPDQIPYRLLGELCTKMQVAEWVDLYERTIKR